MLTKMVPVLSTDEIRNRVGQLGREISDDYKGTQLVALGILKGAFIFLADLVRQLAIPAQVDFIQLSSYGCSTVSSGNVTIKNDITMDIAGRDVLIVEDIIDTGLTIRHLVNTLTERQPRSIKVCAFISKKERREVDVPIDYVGYVIENGFLVGYGLDYGEKYRTSSGIYRLDDDGFD